MLVRSLYNTDIHSSCFSLCFNLLLSVLHSQTLDSINLSWYQSRKIRKPEIMSSSSSSFSSSLTNPSYSHSNQTQMFLLSNISNFVSVKLDHSNFLILKFQITSILDAYSFMEYIDGSIPFPVKFLTNAFGSEAINPNFLQWKARDKVLISLISVTLSPSALSLVIGQTSARGIWEVLEKRYTSISRSNVVNLKIELNGEGRVLTLFPSIFNVSRKLVISFLLLAFSSMMKKFFTLF
jgi:hypothetical protein